MADEFSGKTVTSVAKISIGVLGGTFRVEKVLVPLGEELEGTLKTIRNTPSSSWYVMLGEIHDGAYDTLARIDDNLDFQSMALGRLEKD